jgi:hypothetical protein
MAALGRTLVDDQTGRRYLPMLRMKAIGRAKVATSLVSYLLHWRFITLLRQGKTTVALVTAEALLASGWRRHEESLRC